MGDASEDDSKREDERQDKNENDIHPMVLAARTSSLGVWGRPPALHTKFLHTTDSTATPSAESGSETDVASPSSHSSTSSKTVNESVTPAAHHQVTKTTTTTAFLIHAKIYLLADRYGASTLKDVVLQKLRAALKTSELEPQADHVGSLAELIHNVYQLPPTTGEVVKNQASKDEDTRQKLRQMVVSQAVHCLADLQGNEEFKASLKDGGGEFVQDLLAHLMNRKMSL